MAVCASSHGTLATTRAAEIDTDTQDALVIERTNALALDMDIMKHTGRAKDRGKECSTEAVVYVTSLCSGTPSHHAHQRGAETALHG
jgi:hypothetical protein